MKTYYTPAGLRIVGKGFEIRWQLQKLLETARHPHGPLSDRLSECKPGERLPANTSNVIPFPKA